MTMPPDNQAIEGNLGDDELQQWLTSVGDGAEIELPSLGLGGPFSPPVTEPTGQEGEDDNDDDENDDPDATTEPQDPLPAPVTDAPEGFTLPNGETIAREDVERLYNFDQWMRANPDIAQRMQDTITAPALPTPPSPPVGGPPNVPPATAPTDQASSEYVAPEPPEWMDLDDPQAKWQWDNHIAGQKVLFDQEQRQQRFFAQQAQTTQQLHARQAQTDMDQALTVFKTAHPNLNDDDITNIRKAAGPFVTGMLAQLPPVDALVRSMEVGGMMDNDLRTKLTDPTVVTRTAAQQTRHRKRISGQISGSPRSAPKTEPSRPAYQSDKDFLNSLAEGFREQMQ